MPRRLAAIVYTDIAGYTSLSQADEAAALGLLRDQERIVRGLLEVHQGRLVKSMGDGLLIEFANVLNAVMFATDVQRHIQERNAQEPPPALKVRIGIHLGDVLGAGSDILGDAVNIASRIEPLAEPGGVCVSEPVYVQVHNKVRYQFEEMGSQTLKGVQDPVETYRILLPAGVASIRPTAKDSGPPRLAVLPLTNISPDAENEYFAEGLTEELITVLSQVKGLRVISRISVGQYKGTTKPVAQIGAELGADSVLEGSVRKAGDQLRIAVQLIDTRTDEHRWAQTYDRKLENIFAIQADLAERTASALKVELLTSERQTLQRRPTSNFAAYESYLRGIQTSQRAEVLSSPELHREAVAHFEKAIREDPQFAAAYARLADHLITSGGETEPWTEVVGPARDLVSRALELDPTSSEAHMARGNLALQAELDWNRAEAEYQQAIALNPSNARACRHYAFLLMMLQRYAEAKKQIQAAIEQDPLNFEHRAVMALYHLVVGDLGSAGALLEQLVKEYPVEANPWTREYLALLYAWIGKSADAMQMIEPLASATDVTSRLYHARFMALVGRPEEARALAAEWEAGGFAERSFVGDLGELYACLGDRDRALALLERSAREKDMTLPFHYKDPELDLIRDDPRFVALLRSMHLPITLQRPRFPRPPPTS